MPAAARKIALTDRSLQALRPAPGGARTIIWDALLPGLAVRVSGKGSGPLRRQATRRGRPTQLGAARPLPGHDPSRGSREGARGARRADGGARPGNPRGD